MKSRLIIVCIPLFMLSCSKQKKVKAFIFERKEMANERLFIRFKYLANNTEHEDSAVIANTILKSDTITVNLQASSPKVVVEKESR